jgi:hypothetical protein
MNAHPTEPENRPKERDLMHANQESDGATRVAYILGVPLAHNVVRQWPQMGEIVRTNKLVADVEGNFPELTLEVGRRLRLEHRIALAVGDLLSLMRRGRIFLIAGLLEDAAEVFIQPELEISDLVLEISFGCQF